MDSVLVCGSAIMDMFLDVDTGSVKLQAGGFETDLICFGCGSKIQIRDLKKKIGGGGVNTSVDLARLGVKVSFLGKLGLGHYSKKIFKALVDEGVKVIDTKPSETEGGFSIIIRSVDGDRTILTFKGSNNELGWDDFDKKELDDVEWLYLASMLGRSYETVKKLATWGKEEGRKILFNPSSYIVKKGAEYISDVTSKADIFLVNMEEAQLTLGRPPNAAQLPEDDIDSILRRLHKLGPKIVVVTNGTRRIYVYDGQYKYTTMPYPAEVVEVAGAGDAFSSGFLSGYMKNGEIEYAMKTALAGAYSVVTSPQTWLQFNDMKDADEIFAEFEGREHKIIKQELHG